VNISSGTSSFGLSQTEGCKMVVVISVMCLCTVQDVMDQFFADRDDPEGALWHGLLYTFVGLGALAAMAVVR